VAAQGSLLDAAQLPREHSQQERARRQIGKVVDTPEEIDDGIDVDTRDVAPQVFANLLFIEGQHGEGDVIGLGDALTRLPSEEAHLLGQRSEVVGPAGEEEFARGARLR